MHIVLLLYVHKFSHQGARNVTYAASYVKNFALPHAQIWGLTPSF